MKKKRKRPATIHLRFRKKDPEHNLHAAAQHWVKARGGNLLLTGPVSIIRMPGEPETKFYVAVGCVGLAPEKPLSSGQGTE